MPFKREIWPKKAKTSPSSPSAGGAGSGNGVRGIDVEAAVGRKAVASGRDDRSPPKPRDADADDADAEADKMDVDAAPATKASPKREAPDELEGETAGKKLKSLTIGTQGTKLTDAGIVLLIEGLESLEEFGLVDVEGRSDKCPV